MTETSPYTSNLRVIAKLSPVDFLPDGDLTKKVWKKAERIRFDHDWAGQKHFPEAETQVSCLWTPTSLYFAYRCEYTTLNIYEGEDPGKEKWELWNRDVVEVFVNPHPEHLNHYYEFEVAPNNQWIDLEIKLDEKSDDARYDARWDSHFEHATHLDTKNHLWTCEIRIPVAPMNVSEVSPNTEWRINFYRADGPGDDTVRRFLAWSPTLGEKADFHVPTRFGVIRFVK